MVILSQEHIIRCIQSAENITDISSTFISIDDDDLFISTGLTPLSQPISKNIVSGIIKFTSYKDDNELAHLLIKYDVVVFISSYNEEDILSEKAKVDAWVKCQDQVCKYEVKILPVHKELFSRVNGLYETNVLHEKTVLIVGVGSGGSYQAIEMAKAGVGNFILVDYDRLEVANVVRHICGLSDLGRYKTKAVRDKILDKNPFANVETYEVKCDFDWLAQLQELVRRADLVFCGTDNRPSRVLVNLACIKENRVCIYAGAFRRAFAGQVLRVVPNETMCYQCFIDMFPEEEMKKEISSQEQAEQIAYSDKPVAVEPGLSNDIASIAIMSIKLGILELLRGTNTSLESLYDDLKSNWYLWLNRREKGTDYENLEPMDNASDGVRILTWYVVDSDEKNPYCPVCGDFRSLLKRMVK